MSALATELLHEVFQHRLHYRIFLGSDGIDCHIAEENRIGAYTQIVLHLAEYDLLLGPAVLDDAIEPRVLLHRYFGCVTPKLLDEIISVHMRASIAEQQESPPPKNSLPTAKSLQRFPKNP